jgi:Flp pilus assembly protein TadB
MNDDKHIEKAKAAWQAQRIETPPLFYLKARVLEHSKEGRERSLFEYFGAGAGFVLCVWLAVTTDDTLLRVGLLVLSAGSLYWLAEWRRRKLIWTPTLEGTAETALQCYMQELTRLRDSHRGLWKVQLFTSVPGAGLLAVWLFLVDLPGHHWSHSVWAIAGVVAWIGWIVWHDAEKARRYQRELETLET